MKKSNNMPVRVRGLSVSVRDDNVDRAVKKLRKKVDADGRLEEVNERRFYVKPSEKKRIKRKRAILAQKRKLEE